MILHVPEGAGIFDFSAIGSLAPQLMALIGNMFQNCHVAARRAMTGQFSAS
jgi:hypothetical protein